MPRWLLDTNVVSQAARDPRGVLAKRLAAAAEGELCTSVIVAGELRFGLRRRGSTRLTASVERVLAALPIAPLQPPVGDIYGELRANLEATGRLIGANDLWIAAHAMALGSILVTDDAGFDRVQGLRVENWTRR